MIEIQHIYKTFAGRDVLSDISATFHPGKVNLIIGQSGSGKTVLLKSIVGLHTIDSGNIIFDNRIFNTMNNAEKKLVRREMGMLFQGSALFDSLTVEQNVKFPLDFFTDMLPDEKTERVNFCLNRVNIFNANHLYPSEISGGMQKRVAIARAIALNPKYLFFDEPNSGLDPKTAIVIDQLIKEITHEFQTTTIVNTHDMNSVIGIGDHIIFIHEGVKYWEGDRSSILASDNQVLRDFVFASEVMKRVQME